MTEEPGEMRHELGQGRSAPVTEPIRGEAGTAHEHNSVQSSAISRGMIIFDEHSYFFPSSISPLIFQNITCNILPDKEPVSTSVYVKHRSPHTKYRKMPSNYSMITNICAQYRVSRPTCFVPWSLLD